MDSFFPYQIDTKVDSHVLYAMLFYTLKAEYDYFLVSMIVEKYFGPLTGNDEADAQIIGISFGTDIRLCKKPESLINDIKYRINGYIVTTFEPNFKFWDIICKIENNKIKDKNNKVLSYLPSEIENTYYIFEQKLALNLFYPKDPEYSIIMALLKFKSQEIQEFDYCDITIDKSKYEKDKEYKSTLIIASEQDKQKIENYTLECYYDYSLCRIFSTDDQCIDFFPNNMINKYISLHCKTVVGRPITND